MKSSRPASTSCCQIIIAATILTIISSFLFLLANNLPNIQSFTSRQCTTAPAQPESVRLKTTFESIPALEDFSPKADAAWEALSPRVNGFLQVQYNETYIQSWGISMFHQLHCLGHIRRTLQIHMGLADSRAHHHGGSKAEQHMDDVEHVAHCFAYLAQAIECTADGTIEPPWTAHDRAGYIKANGVDGLGVVHQCRSTKHLWSVASMSERKAVEMWGWKEGDEIGNVFEVEEA